MESGGATNRPKASSRELARGPLPERERSKAGERRRAAQAAKAAKRLAQKAMDSISFLKSMALLPRSQDS